MDVVFVGDEYDVVYGLDGVYVVVWDYRFVFFFLFVYF